MVFIGRFGLLKEVNISFFLSPFPFILLMLFLYISSMRRLISYAIKWRNISCFLCSTSNGTPNGACILGAFCYSGCFHHVLFIYGIFFGPSIYLEPLRGCWDLYVIIVIGKRAPRDCTHVVFARGSTCKRSLLICWNASISNHMA